MINKIKILHIVSDLNSGGVENMLYNYINYIDNSKFDIAFVSHSYGGMINDQLLKAGFRVFYVTPRKKNFIKNILDLWKYMHSDNWDIVHSHINQMSAIPILLARISGIRVRIAHAHGSKIYNDKIKKIIYNILSKIILYNANYLMACGTDAAVRVFGKRIVRQKKVIYLKNAIDLEKFSYNKKSAQYLRSNLGINERYIILHVARLSEEKNHIFSIEVFCKLIEKNPNMRLLIIGEGPLKEKLKQKVLLLGLDNKVSFLGARKDVSSFMSLADCLLLPSFHEGLPLVPIEAQANGLQCYLSKNVPEEVVLTEKACRLDLSLGPAVWAEYIYNNLSKERISDKKIIQKAGYDIKLAAKKLENFYIVSATKMGKILYLSTLFNC